MVTEEPKVALDGKYSVTQAARVLGSHRNSVRNWIDAGKLKFGLNKEGRVRISGRQILAFWRMY